MGVGDDAGVDDGVIVGVGDDAGVDDVGVDAGVGVVVVDGVAGGGAGISWVFLF